MEAFVSGLKQETRCSLCTERLIEPKLLKCFHTFCKACIKRHSLLQPEGNTFQCTECSSKTVFPELNDVDDINTSLLHTRILKVLEFVESDKVCSVSKSHCPATWYCFDCTSSLCDDCQTSHFRFTKGHNHKVISLSNLNKEDLEFILAREDNCDRHDGCKMDFFCQDCDVFMCLECLKLDNGDHKTILNEKHANTIRETLTNELRKLEAREQEVSFNVKVLEDIAVKTKDNCEKVMKEIKQKAKKIIEKVQESERELIEELQERIENSNKEKKKGCDVLNRTRRARGFVNQVIEKRLPPSCMKNIKVFDEIIPAIQDLPRVVFAPGEEYSGLMKVGIGKLNLENSQSPCIFKRTNKPKRDRKIKESFIIKVDSTCMRSMEVKEDDWDELAENIPIQEETDRHYRRLEIRKKKINRIKGLSKKDEGFLYEDELW